MKIQTSLIGLLFIAAPAIALAAQTSVSLGAGFVTPADVSINAGDTVVWNNISSSNQSVTANSGSFKSGNIAPGGQFAATFNSTGTYNYYDNAGGSAVVGEVLVGGVALTTPVTYVNPNATYQTISTTNSSASVASLTSEVQALIAEIDSLQGSGGVSTGTSVGACPQIGRVLSVGSSGSDVASLQEFLAISVRYTGGATGYFGPLTQAAVEQYQAANNIISYGTPATTGYGVVGPRTAAAIRLSCQGGSGSNSGSGVVSGFIQVSPISGTSPLTVTVVATINTANSCGGGTYTLSFGDGTGTQTLNASGNCSQQNQSFQHTYPYGGTYTVTLSAGTHQSTATVTVSGPAAPGTASSNPTGSISALVTSGAPPLATTFYVSCVSGLAYDVVFGDGSDLGSSAVSQSTCNGALQAVTHTYSASGTYQAQLEIFVRNPNGTVSPTNVAEQTIVVGSGSSSSSSSAGSYPPPTVVPNVGGNPLTVSLQYNYDTNGCEVSVNWGDGTSVNPTGCSTFSGQEQSFTLTHTYSQGGSYTITLERATQTNSVGVSISD